MNIKLELSCHEASQTVNGRCIDFHLEGVDKSDFINMVVEDFQDDIIDAIDWSLVFYGLSTDEILERLELK